MSGAKEVREFLEARGCSSDVVDGGLPGLVEDWERIAGEMADGYTLGLDDYLNDLDVRQLIEEAMEHAGDAGRRAVAKRLAAADAQVRAVVRTVDECLWGDRVAAASGWSPESNWWYFSLPRRPGRRLREDLEEESTGGDS
jgi:hypothetical protein